MPVPSGTVALLIDGNAVGSVNLDGSGNGSDALSTTGIAVGGHTLTANYSGDQNFNPINKSVLFNIGNPMSNANLSVSTSPEPCPQGQTLNISISVTPA